MHLYHRANLRHRARATGSAALAGSLALALLVACAPPSPGGNPGPGPTTTAPVTVSSAELAPWSTTTNLPKPRSRNGAVYANGFVYVIGGMDNNKDVATVYYAPVNPDGSIGAWKTTTKLPQGRRTVRPAFYNGFVYLAGGNSGFAAGSFHDEVYVARVNGDGTLGAWQSTTRLPATQTSHSTLAYNGYLYIVGGNVGLGCTGKVLYAPIRADGTLGSWQSTAGLPEARCGNVEAVTIANGVMYAAGGYNNSDVTRTVYYTTINADGTLGGWLTNATQLGNAREYNSTEVLNGHLYVIGGQASLSGSSTTSVEVATINADGSVGPFASTASLPGARSEPASEVINGRIYVLGGGQDGQGGAPQSSVFVTGPARSGTAAHVLTTTPAPESPAPPADQDPTEG